MFAIKPHTDTYQILQGASFLRMSFFGASAATDPDSTPVATETWEYADPRAEAWNFTNTHAETWVHNDPSNEVWGG